MLTKELLCTDEFWTKPLNKLLAKQNISKPSKSQLVLYASLEKESIVDELLNGTYQWSIPQKVLIQKSGTTKFRVVYIYDDKDRLVLGVLYHALNRAFADQISDACYSYKEGINTARAVTDIMNYDIYDMYGVKLDIHSYFNSVAEDYLHKMIEDLFPESCGLKTTIENLMYDNRCKQKGEIIDEYKALIAGTPIASFFANYGLRDMDFYFQEQKIPYGRYSDDILLFGNSPEEIATYLDVVKGYLKDRGLVINEKKYEYYDPQSEITFLGLKFNPNGVIDISDHAKKKIKNYIHNLCKRARKQLEINHESFEFRAKKVTHRINQKNFKCYIQNENTFGWCHYAFRYITTEESLREIDLYTKERLRYLKTGKNNKANYRKMTDAEFTEIGWVSLVQLYHLYKSDFDYYCETISLI